MQESTSNLASNVSDFRKKLGLSQEALAEKANVSLSTIQRIEKGTVNPRAFTIKVLAETLGIDILELTSFPSQDESLKPLFLSLKKINLTALLLAFIPFINLISPLIVWKKDTSDYRKNTIAGKIVSFQLLWSIVTIVGMGITLFLSNLILGNAGNGLFIILTFYLLAVLFNVFMIAKTSFQLNKEDENVLPFIPNLF